MEKYFEILSKCPLFLGISPEDIERMLGCLGGKVVEIAKDSPVFLEGEPASFLGVVLSGTVQIVRDDYYGSRSVLTAVRRRMQATTGPRATDTRPGWAGTAPTGPSEAPTSLLW